MATDKTTIESYNKYTIKSAEKMRSGKNIKHTFLEKPAMYKKLPDLKGKTVLCIGCGTGEECEHIKSLGAKRVVGIDISKERINFLKKDGMFLFSTHHPIKWGAEINKLKDKNTFLLGYKKYKSGESKVFGDYLTTRKINDVLSSEGFKVSYYHRPISELISDIIKSGFIISDFIEPKPLKSVLKVRPEFYKIYSKIPLYMIFELKKNLNIILFFNSFHFFYGKVFSI